MSTANALDRNIGHALNYLDKTELAKNTVVIYASDQGFYLGEHGWFDKRFMYEESLKTPFVIRYPDVIKPRTQIHRLVSNLDWAPTILNLAEAAVDQEMQGVSFLPLLKGQQTSWRKQAYYHYYEFPKPCHIYPHFGLRTEHYKLIRFYGLKNFWELYNLKKDPYEVHNVYGQKGYETLITTLKTNLREQIKHYKDEEALKLFDEKR